MATDGDRVGAAGQRRRHLPAQVTYAVGSDPSAIVAGDFNGDGRTDLAVANSSGTTPATCRCCWATATAPSSPGDVRGGDRPDRARGGDFNGDGRTDLAVANLRLISERHVGAAGQRRRHLPDPGARTRWGPTRSRSWPATSTATAAPTWPSRTTAPTTCRCCWATATAPSSDPGQLATALHATPLVADFNGDGTDDVLVVDAAGDILYRQGLPGQPGSFQPPVTVNPGKPARDIAYVSTPLGPVIAAVDAEGQRGLPLRLPRRTLRPGRVDPHRAHCRRRSSRATSSATGATTSWSATRATAP